ISAPNDADTLALVVSSNRGCAADTAWRIFRTLKNPNANIVLSVDSGCTPVTQLAKPSFSNPAFAYRWTASSRATLLNPGLNDSTLRFSSVNASFAPITDSVKLVVTSNQGCRDSAWADFTILPRPTGSIVAADSICANQNVLLSYAGSAKSIITRYQWSAILGNNLTTPNDSATLATIADAKGIVPFSQSFKLVFTSAFGCADSALKSIRILPRPVIAINPFDSTICAATSVLVRNDSAVTGQTHRWSSFGANSRIRIVSPNAAASQIYAFDRQSLADSSYNIALKVTSSSGCADSTFFSLLVNPRPTAAFSPAFDTVCAPAAGIFNNLSQGQGFLSYAWNIKGTASNLFAPSFNFTNSGVVDSTVAISLTVTAPTGCSDTLIANRIIKPKAKAQFNFTAVDSACAPFSINPAAFNVVHYPIANQSYQWLINGVPVAAPAAFPIAAPVHTISAPNDADTLALVVSSNRGCAADTAWRIFRTLKNPNANIVLSVDSGCTPLRIQANSSSASAFQWILPVQASLLGGGLNSNFIDFSLVNSGIVDQNQLLTLISRDGNGCKDTAQTQIQ
ncbi:MAG: hypothetical protein ACOVOL_03970, partial [Bacteroidia bacterium]